MAGGRGCRGPTRQLQLQLQLHSMITGGDKNNVGHQHDGSPGGAHGGPSGALSGRHRPPGPGARPEPLGEATEGQDERHPGRAGGAGYGQHRHPHRFGRLHRVRNPRAGGCCGSRRRGPRGGSNQLPREAAERRSTPTRAGPPAPPDESPKPGRTMDAGHRKRGRWRKSVRRHPDQRVGVHGHEVWWSGPGVDPQDQLGFRLDPQDQRGFAVWADWVRRCQYPAWTRWVRSWVGIGPKRSGVRSRPGTEPKVRARVRIEDPEVGVDRGRIGPEVGIGRVWRLAEVQAAGSPVGIEPDPEPGQQAGSALPTQVGYRTSTLDRTPVREGRSDQPRRRDPTPADPGHPQRRTSDR